MGGKRFSTGRVSVVAGALVALVGLGEPGLAQAPRAADVESLRKDWHGCVREAFSAQPVTADKRTAQRAALAACKPSENALVAAELTVQQDAEDSRRKGSLTWRARAWASSVAGTVVDPVMSWIGGIGR